MASIYDAARAAYLDCVNDLAVMGKATEEIMREKGKNFSPRVLLNQFDVLLQYSMLQLALADGYLASEELAFIRDLTQYSNICEFLKTVGYGNATWNTIYNTEESKLNNIVAEICDDVVKLSSDFVSIFAAFDKATDYDYFEDLKRNVSIIITATCQADGHAEARELENGCLIIDAMAAINRLMN